MSKYAYKDRRHSVFKAQSATAVQKAELGKNSIEPTLPVEEWDFDFDSDLEFLNDYAKTVWMYNYEFARSSRQMRQLVWAMRNYEAKRESKLIARRTKKIESQKRKVSAWPYDDAIDEMLYANQEQNWSQYLAKASFETDCDEFELPDDPKFEEKYLIYKNTQLPWTSDNLSFAYCLVSSLGEFDGTAFPRLPWQKLPHKVRTLHWKPHGIWHLEKDPYKSEPLLEVRYGDPYYLSQERLGRKPGNLPGKYPVAFLINFYEFKEDEILAGFKTWLDDRIKELEQYARRLAVDRKKVRDDPAYAKSVRDKNYLTAHKTQKARGGGNYKNVFTIDMESLGYCRLLAFYNYDHEHVQELYNGGVDGAENKVPDNEKTWKTDIARTCQNFSRLKAHWLSQPTCFQYIKTTQSAEPPAEELIRGKSLPFLIDELKKVLFAPS